MMQRSADNRSDTSLSRPAYSSAAAGSWMEHGPHTTRRRSSVSVMMAAASRRPCKTTRHALAGYMRADQSPRFDLKMDRPESGWRKGAYRGYLGLQQLWWDEWVITQHYGADAVVVSANTDHAFLSSLDPSPLGRRYDETRMDVPRTSSLTSPGRTSFSAMEDIGTRGGFLGRRDGDQGLLDVRFGSLYPPHRPKSS